MQDRVGELFPPVANLSLIISHRDVPIGPLAGFAHEILSSGILPFLLFPPTSPGRKTVFVSEDEHVIPLFYFSWNNGRFP